MTEPSALRPLLATPGCGRGAAGRRARLSRSTITFYNYVMAFRMLRMGRASALGVVTLLILSVVRSA